MGALVSVRASRAPCAASASRAFPHRVWVRATPSARTDPMAPARPYLLFAALLVACDAEVRSDLDESQADEIVLALEARSIDARKERDEARGEASYRVL